MLTMCMLCMSTDDVVIILTEKMFNIFTLTYQKRINSNYKKIANVNTAISAVGTLSVPIVGKGGESVSFQSKP